MSGDKGNRDKNEPYRSPNKAYNHQQKEDQHSELWGAMLFGLIGATGATMVYGHMRGLKAFDWFCSQLTGTRVPWREGAGKSFREEAWKKYNRRMQEEYEEEMERVERIRRMQSVFNRERNKHRRGYESWREGGAGAGPGQYHQHSQREDWYWKSDPSFKDRRANNSYREAPRQNLSFSLSHHYSVLGLDRFRTKPYTEAEIKTAFRAKAMQFHPDQNQENKEIAEAKFKEVMVSYEAIKREMSDPYS